jgi:hypothetical protein
VRASLTRTSRLRAATYGHFPTWLPSDFRLSAVYENGTAWWSDHRCREVTVEVYGPGEQMAGPSVGRWHVWSDAPGRCSNQVLGVARCLGYQARFGGHRVTVEMMGLDRGLGDRIVRSIH